jgi:hypothetical protein
MQPPRPTLSRIALAAILALLVPACERPPVNAADRLDASLTAAAGEFRVPKALLAGIGYAETRWRLYPGTPSIDQGFGPMHLVDGGVDSSLQRAARLVKLPPELLKTDLDANLRGGAALLREAADRYFGEYSGKHQDDLAAWWQVVMRYSGYENPQAADEFAAAVYGAVTHGAAAALEDLSVFRLPATLVDTSGEQIFGHSEQALAPDYPTADWIPANSGNYTVGRPAKPSMIVIHTAQGSYSATYNWFQNPSSQVSAHYVVRSADGHVASMVHDLDTAWHAGNWSMNQRAVGIEHEGFVDQPSYLTDAMYQSSANLTRWVCDTYGIPKDRQHIIGHYEIPDPNHPGQFGGAGHHVDPCVTIDGTQCFWDWNKYMALVNPQQVTPPPTGTLQGFVYSSDGGAMPAGNTVPIAGARVFIPETGDTQTSDAKGFWKFALPPGSYSPSASMSGFTDGSPFLGAKRQVTAGQISWGSFVLQKIQQTGTVQAFVYVVNPTNAADQATPAAGAIVSLGSATCSTGADGKCSLVAASGSQQVQATKDGYDAVTASVTVPANGSVAVALGLKSSTGVAPTIQITSPKDGDAFTSVPITIKGVATGDQLTVTVSGVSAALASDGTFSAVVSPMAGESSVTAVAKDIYGRLASASVKIVYDNAVSGVQGTVTDAVTAQPVANAVLTSGAAVTQTAGDGSYSLPLASGPQPLTVQATGFGTRVLQVTVPQGSLAQRNIELLADGAGPVVSILSPVDGSSVSASPVIVTGTVSFALVDALTVNGVSAVVSSGKFAAHIPLGAGKQVITAHAVSHDGLEASQSVTVMGPKSGCGCTSGGDFGLLALVGWAIVRVRAARLRPSLSRRAHSIG